MQKLIKNEFVTGLALALLAFANSVSAQLTVTGTNVLGAVPLTPPWSAAPGSLISGLTPSATSGNFGEYTGANANNLSRPGVPLTIYPYSSPQATNLEVAGNDGTAGKSLVYSLPPATYGYDLTNITVFGGWQDNGRDSQAYTVSYSTVANPAGFFRLAQVNFSPEGGPAGSANRVIINDAAGAPIARSVAALKFDFTTPPSENSAVGYTAITVQGAAATVLTPPPIVITTANQNGSSSFTPAWPLETNSLIAGQLPGTFGSGNFTIVAGSKGLSALTDGAVGDVGAAANFAFCGTNAGRSLAYSVNGATLTNIVVYSGWRDATRDGQFYDVSYSTLDAPADFFPLASVNYNPAVTGFSANRVAIGSSTETPLATNVAFLQFNFAPQISSLDNGYSGYAEIIVQGTPGSQPSPLLGSSPIPEPYPCVNSGSFSGPAVPLSPDPLVAYRWPAPQADDGLQIYMLKPVSVSADTNASFANLQSLTSTNPYVTVQGKGSIRMDFGQENAAWLEFDSPDLAGAVAMSVGEYNEPELTGSSFKTAVPVKYGNTYRLELNTQLYEGVRFGWIHITSYSGPWHITGLRLVCQTKPANYNGSFSCSDPMLTRIWYTGAYTVKLNREKDYLGAILVERGDRIAWTGDDHCAQAASLAAFADYDFVKANIDSTANNANGIASYALYWVLSLIDYYNYTGDAATVGKYISTAQSILDGAYSSFGNNPGLGFYGWDERLGAGFEHPNCAEAENAYKMLSIKTWSAFAATMGSYGRTDLQTKYNGYATQKMAALRQASGWYQTFGLHAAADAVNTGLLTASEKNTLFTKQFSDRVNRISFSPFNQYFVIQAFAGMDKYDDALNSISDLWGGEINYGGTTFFEVYRPTWNAEVGPNGAVPNNQCGWTSLCHPWSAGVVKWLSEEILGIKPTSPGFASYQIVPHLGRTLMNVAGQMPTPLGPIAASFNVSNGICSFSAPVGTVGTVGIPKVEKNIDRITINGALAWDGAFHTVPGIGGANADAEFVYFTGIQPGSYALNVSYSGTTPTYAAPPLKYAARLTKIDSATAGNWGGVYGQDGYLLCNYNGGSSDKKSLPSYVSSVDWSSGMPSATVWASGTTDARALAPDAGNGTSRNAACYYANPDVPVTITVTGTNYFQIALYFVDWDNKGRRVAVETFAGDSLIQIAPEKIVTNFYGGKYFVYTLNQSVRFRFDQVRGDNAVLSGIFFDPAPTNTAPVLGAISDKYVHLGESVHFTVSVTDAQSLAQSLTYSLSNAPAGATIDAVTGAFSWVTTNATPGTNPVTVRVSDDGLPPLSDSKTFSVIAFGPPQFTGAVEEDGLVQLTFDTLPGQNYQLQYKASLLESNWMPIGGLLSGAGLPLTVSEDTSASAQRFYRLQASP